MKNLHKRVRPRDRVVYGDPRLPPRETKHPGSKKAKRPRKKRRRGV